MNADDFGLTPGVNRAIVELHQAGVLTSATLMAKAAATSEAIEMARATPTLGVGCHVVLVDGEPVLPPARLPALIDQETGRFPVSLGVFLARLFTGRIRPGEIEAEAAAQISAASRTAACVSPTSTPTNTRTCSRPFCGRCCALPARPAFARCGIRSSRSGRCGPRRALRRCEPQKFSRCGGWDRISAADCAQRFATTDGTIAVVGTGTLDSDAVRSLLSELPEGTWELVTHPGYNDADLDRIRTRLSASRETERQALATRKIFQRST